MKRIILALIAITCVNVIFAQDFVKDGLSYSIDDINNVYTRIVDTNIADLNIPAKVDYNDKTYNVIDISDIGRIPP